jgi:hypothetical protein
MPIDKSKWDMTQKVSQSTIDMIKKMGMTNALASVAGAKKSSADDPSARSFVEGVTRLYGANRVSAAIALQTKPGSGAGAQKMTPSSTKSGYATPGAQKMTPASGGKKMIPGPGAPKVSLPRTKSSKNLKSM